MFQKIWFILLLSVVATIFTTTLGFSQPANISFEHFNTDNGLITNKVHGILEDKDGFMWFATDAGLVRYDGYEFKPYVRDPLDSNSIESSQVLHMMLNKEGNIWVGLFGEYYDLYDIKLDRFKHYEKPGGTRCFLEDEKGDLWIGAWEWLWRLKKGESVCDSIPEAGYIGVGTLYKDQSGKIWLGTGDSIIKYDPELENYTVYPIGPAWGVSSMFEDGDGDFWIGTNNDGLILFDRQTGKQTNYRHDPENIRSLSSNTVSAILEDSGNNLWIGTNNGLNYFDKVSGQFTRYQHDNQDRNSISANVITDICEDRGGNLWISTESGGINMLRGHRYPFYHYHHDPEDPGSLSHNVVTTFFERPDGNVWIGTKGGGLNLFLRKTDAFVRYPPVNEQNVAEYFIYEDKEGYVWVGSPGYGSFRFLPTEDHGYGDKSVHPGGWWISEDGKGNVWITSVFGIHRYNVDEEKSYFYNADDKPSNGLKESHTNSVYEDSEGNIWICAPAGIYLYHPEKEYFTLKSDEECIAVVSDKDGNLLIANSTGYAKYNWRTDSYFQYMDFGSIAPIGAKDDDHGNQWVISPSGLFMIHAETRSVKKYGRLDGMMIDQFYVLSYMKSRTGEIFFGGYNGFIVFHPDSIKDNPYVPPIVITDFLLANQSVSISGSVQDTTEFRSPLAQSISYTDEVILPYSQNFFSFEFTALNYNNPNKNEYKYKMTGFNEDWIYSDANKRVATYTNLSPGDYVFTVTGSNNDGVWNDEVKSVKITILPPWWLTMGAKVGYVSLFIGGVWGFIFVRTQKHKRKFEEAEQLNSKLRQIDKLKDQFLANTSHELRTPLQGIIGLSESLVDGATGKLSQATQDVLSMITTSGKRLSLLVNDILDFSKLKNRELALQKRPVDVHSAADVVLTLAGPLVRNKGIKLVNEVPGDLPLVEADENRLQQIFQNLVGNAIKFTDHGTVAISAQSNDHHVKVTVSDTGIGIPEDQLELVFAEFEQGDGSTAREYGGTGLGLSVTKQLVELHGGDIQVKSEKEKGSHFTFTLPLSNTDREKLPELKFADGIEEQIHVPEPDKETLKNESEEILESKYIPEISPEQIKILVVDDEPINLEVLKSHLTMAGYQVTLANDGMEALEILEKGETFDLIILDVMMPRLSGYQVCNKLRDMFLPSELPVVMLTAKNRVTDLVDGFAAGANDYLTKPFSKQELLSRIKVHLHLHRIHKATGKFVPFEFLRYLGRDSIVDVQLGDQTQQEVTVLFCDIRDYTTLSEEMSPEDNFRFINSFVGRMGPIIKQHEGFINQFMGDGIMAIFPKDVTHGLNAAVEMQKEIDKYNRERQEKARKPFHVGIGLHTGQLIMGIIGDETRSDPSIISDTVNIASRMEGMTKYYGTRIMISDDSYKSMAHPENFHFRYLGDVLVKGKYQPVKVYECFDGDNSDTMVKKKKTLEDFKKGLKHYHEKDFPEASVVFNNIVKENPEDKTAQYYYKLAAKFALKGVKEDWDGVVKMDEK